MMLLNIIIVKMKYVHHRTEIFLLAFSDTLIAAQNAVVAAESMGIESCYIGDIIEQYEIDRDLLNLPQYTAPVGMLVMG